MLPMFVCLGRAGWEDCGLESADEMGSNDRRVWTDVKTRAG